jgi:cytochrome c553
MSIINRHLVFFSWLVLTSVLVMDPLYAAGDIAAGQAKSTTCVACHGPDGNSVVDFRKGEKGPRYEPSMYAIVANLSDQDLDDLAVYYSSQTQTLGKAKAQYVAEGEKIYKGGNLTSGAAACTACHGPQGKGLPEANFPRLAGQHADYLVLQLQAFKKGTRSNSPNGMMEDISHRLTDEQMKAVSSYIEGLR